MRQEAGGLEVLPSCGGVALPCGVPRGLRPWVVATVMPVPRASPFCGLCLSSVSFLPTRTQTHSKLSPRCAVG